jgi:hypothetical protein
VVAQPQRLGRLKAGERRVAGDRAQPPHAHPILKLHALGAGALVVPEERRPDHPSVAVEEDRSVHLPGEADRLDSRGRRRGELAQYVAASPPPGVRFLLSPAGLGRQQRILARGAPDHGAIGGDENALGAAGANIQADGETVPHECDPSGSAAAHDHVPITSDSAVAAPPA